MTSCTTSYQNEAVFGWNQLCLLKVTYFLNSKIPKKTDKVSFINLPMSNDFLITSLAFSIQKRMIYFNSSLKYTLKRSMFFLLQTNADRSVFYRKLLFISMFSYNFINLFQKSCRLHVKLYFVLVFSWNKNSSIERISLLKPLSWNKNPEKLVQQLSPNKMV